MNPSKITSYCKIDDRRMLFGDLFGRLSVLCLPDKSDFSNFKMKFDYLGMTSCSSTISYLDSGYVYVGSGYGDSMLIKLNTTKVLVIDSFIYILE